MTGNNPAEKPAQAEEHLSYLPLLYMTSFAMAGAAMVYGLANYPLPVGGALVAGGAIAAGVLRNGFKEQRRKTSGKVLQGGAAAGVLASVVALAMDMCKAPAPGKELPETPAHVEKTAKGNNTVSHNAANAAAQTTASIAQKIIAEREAAGSRER